MVEALILSLFKNRTFPDVTFQLNGKEVKAHKAVLAERCEYFKQLFEQNRSNVITMDETSFKLFKEVVNYCYLQPIDLATWSYHEKECLHKLATAYKYGPLMDFVKKELDKRPEVPLSVDTLNDWYNNSPGEELGEWIKNNPWNIVNYEDCHKYSQDLIIFILDTFNEMYFNERNYELRSAQKKLVLWLFRWRNWSNRDEEDVRNLFLKVRLPFVEKDPALEIETVQRKSFIQTNVALFLVPVSFQITAKYDTAIKDFVIFRKLNTNGWTCHEILKLLSLAHKNDFSQLFDAALNVLTTQHLEPSSFATIYGVARKLKSRKLEQVLVDYFRNNTNSIFSEFPNYPASVFEFILDNLSDQVIDEEMKWLIFTSMRNWVKSNSDKEVKKVRNNVQCQDFIEKLITDLFINSFKDDDSKDVTFVFGKQEIKAHKRVLAHSCNTLKQLLDQNKNNRINMEGTRIEPFYQLIKHCYMRKPDLRGWGYSEKEYLYELATKYNYQSLMDMVKIELDKRPKVPLSVASLNEWYMIIPDEKIREWVKNNLLNIVTYEDCHKYYQDLVVLIMDTFCELSNKTPDEEKLETPLKKLLLWLYRWRNSCIRREEDVQSLFAKIRLPLVFKDRALGDKTLQKKLFAAVRRFCRVREVDTAGWTCDDVLELLYFAHDYEFYPLMNAVVSTLATQHLEPASLVKIHQLTCRLVSDKLQETVADYIKNHAMIILTSAEFTNYPASLVEFILQNVSSQGMDVNVKNQMLTSLWNWKTSKSAEEFKAVFTKIQWEDFSPEQLAAVLRLVIPLTTVADISGLPATAGKGVKRKLSDNSHRRRRGRPRKE